MGVNIFEPQTEKNETVAVNHRHDKDRHFQSKSDFVCIDLCTDLLCWIKTFYKTSLHKMDEGNEFSFITERVINFMHYF